MPIDCKIKAILAEYNALRSEILNRQTAELRLMEFHIAVLTAIIGFAFYKEKVWVLYLIPLESSLFGIWYLRNERSIMIIGGYIKSCIEDTVEGLLNHKYMAWEHYLDNRSKNPPHKVYVTYDLVSVIFCGPPIIILFMISPILYFKYYSYLSLYDAGLWFFGFILLVLYWRELRDLEQNQRHRKEIDI